MARLLPRQDTEREVAGKHGTRSPNQSHRCSTLLAFDRPITRELQKLVCMASVESVHPR